jgi:hypothetical protein
MRPRYAGSHSAEKQPNKGRQSETKGITMGPETSVCSVESRLVAAQHSSSSLTVAKSIIVLLVMVSPDATLCEQTFQFLSNTCCRAAPVASCDVVTAIPKLVSRWIVSCASWRFDSTRLGMLQLDCTGAADGGAAVAIGGAVTAGTAGVDDDGLDC